MLSVLFVPRHVPVPGTCMTPHRSLEPDQMETSVKPWRLIRRVSARGSGLDGERKDKCVLSGKGPGEAPRCSLGGLGSSRSEQDTQTPVMGRRGCFLLGAGCAV